MSNYEQQRQDYLREAYMRELTVTVQAIDEARKPFDRMIRGILNQRDRSGNLLKQPSIIWKLVNKYVSACESLGDTLIDTEYWIDEFAISSEEEFEDIGTHITLNLEYARRLNNKIEERFYKWFAAYAPDIFAAVGLPTFGGVPGGKTAVTSPGIGGLLDRLEAKGRERRRREAEAGGQAEPAAGSPVEQDADSQPSL